MSVKAGIHCAIFAVVRAHRWFFSIVWKSLMLIWSRLISCVMNYEPSRVPYEHGNRQVVKSCRIALRPYDFQINSLVTIFRPSEFAPCTPALTKQISPPIYYHIGKIHTMVVNGGWDITDILPNIFLCVQQNKEIHTGLELLEGE